MSTFVFKNYGDLVDTIKSYINRTDNDVIGKIGMWTRMAEGVLDRELRHPALDVKVEYVLLAGLSELPIPRDLNTLHSLRIKENNFLLYRATHETLYDNTDGYGFPTKYAQIRNKYVMNRAVAKDTAIDYVYRTSPEVMTNTDHNNVYLTSMGDFLLYYALHEAFVFIENTESAQMYRMKADDILRSVKVQVESEELSGSTRVYFGDDLDNDYY